MSGSLPRRPLLAPWYRLLGDGERLLLEHGRTVVVLEGAAVRVLLPALLPLLDGRRTIEELAVRLGHAARPAIVPALEILASHGLLVEGPDAPPELRASAHAVAGAFDLTPGDAASRLRAATVGVVGSAATGAEIARLLHSSGISDVRRLSWRRAPRIPLVVVAPAADEVDALAGWNRLALDRGLNWLPVRPYDGSVATVGPLVVPGESPCYECLLLRLAANVEYGDDLAEIDAVPVSARSDAALEALVAALAAHLALRWVAGRDTTLPGVLHVVEGRPALRWAEHPVLRVPRCHACSPADRLASPLPWHEAGAA